MPDPVTINAMILGDQKVGQGMVLAFPQVSTCTAVVAVLPDRLVGGHFTADPATLGLPSQSTINRVNFMQGFIGNAPITRLVIVGYNHNHNPQNIKALLGCDVGGVVTEAYDITRKGIMEVTLIFTFAGGGVRPLVEFKRQTKVTVQMVAQQGGDLVAHGRTGTVEIGNTQHYLRQHFVGI